MHDWKVARNIVIAPTDSEAHDRVLDATGPNYFYFDYLWRVLKAADYTAVMKNDASVPDDQFTVESLMESMVVYGSPDTVTEKLKVLREETGPFGTLLMAMMDGSNGFEKHERETMELLAQEVAPQIG